MKKIILMILGLGLAAASLPGCARQEAPKNKIFPVNTIKVAPKPIASMITLAGTVDSKMHSSVSSPVEGSVFDIKAVEGQRVSRGRILCYIMPAEQQNMLGQAQADYEMAKAAYESRTGGEQEALAENLKQAGERLASAKKLNKPVPVVSPADGTIIMKTIEIGNNVSAKQVLMEIADLRQLIVKSAVSEDDVSSVKIGRPVQVKLHSLAGDILEGKISLVTPGIRLESRTADIEVSLPDNPKLRPGMTATLSLAVQQKNNALAIPLDAVVMKPNGDRYVFTVNNKIAKMVKIETGIESNTGIEVLSGLSAGEQVVVVGQGNLKNNAKVKLPKSVEKSGHKGGKQ